MENHFYTQPKFQQTKKHKQKCFNIIIREVTIKKQTRADTAQTHGPPRSVKISFLLHNVCRTGCSWPTAVSGLRPGWDMFVLVCSVRW